MGLKFNLIGNERKAFVIAIGEVLGIKPEYLGAPSFAYKIGNFTVDKEATLSCEYETDVTITENLLTKLSESGFESEKENNFTIEIPKDDITIAALENLKKLIESKSSLIKKALDTKTPDFEICENTIRFPWFLRLPTADEVTAYTRFIVSMVDISKTLNRVNGSRKETDNEKYTFRCFLLRLGFIGDEFKAERKILLSKLDGNTAFKNKAAAE